MAIASQGSTQPPFPLWDGKETQADYAGRAGIKDVEITLELGDNITMKLVLIPAGKFLMGSPDDEIDRFKDEGPQHEVTISKPFYMGVYEVTQEQYEQVVGENPSDFKGAQNPVENLFWEHAVEFCGKLSARTCKIVTVPTEAEWEYACRAGTTTPFNTGETISTDQANYDGRYVYGAGGKGQYRQETLPVGSFKPNRWGLYDMHGNVWEWCSDLYGRHYYASSEDTDPQGPATGSHRMLRGGAHFRGPRYCRSANRDRHLGGFRYDIGGFRVVVGVADAN